MPGTQNLWRATPALRDMRGLKVKLPTGLLLDTCMKSAAWAGNGDVPSKYALSFSS
jgi:hypothetical protein